MSRRRPSSEGVGGAEPAANALERRVEKALASGAGRSRALAEKVAAANPGASPADVVALLERRYRRRVSLLSAAVGLTAAVPGVGTGVAALLTAANLGSYLRASTTFVGAVAHVHGVDVEDVARRRTMLLAALLGQDGAHALHGELGVSTLYWGRGLLTRLPLGTVRAANKGLSRRLVRAAAAKGGAMMLGRLAPFGIGAVVGWFVGRRLAGQVVTGSRDAFGPVPADATLPQVNA
ncbi:hypothetical protein M3148_15975 [Georgenia satyanarayanai]|uniref:hypothetical protein n=1 Tax=Georgenia satyanarayanai TaxID=860221 RepID=UPI00203EE0BF|nr:hypothetical protein [Georgenia satyanarayanai]MCM3662477.1 hypothetical protein [Georgenia satyanarayanai]